MREVLAGKGFLRRAALLTIAPRGDALHGETRVAGLRDVLELPPP